MPCWGAAPHVATRPRPRDAPGRVCDGDADRHPQPSGRASEGHGKPPELAIRSRNVGGRVSGMLAAPLEESASTARPLKARKRIGIGFVAVPLAAGIASCGGGSRQDANEPSGDFPVRIVSADFPSKQQLAGNTNLTLSVDEQRRQDHPRPGDHDLHHLEREHERLGDLDAPAPPARRRAATREAEPARGIRARSPCGPSSRASRSRRGRSGSSRRAYPKLDGQTASAGAEAAQTDTYSFGVAGGQPDQRDGLERDAGAGRHLHGPLPRRGGPPGQGEGGDHGRLGAGG